MKLPLFLAVPLALCALGSAHGAAPPPPGTEVKLDIYNFEVVERDSGPVVYYKFVKEEGTKIVRALYRPPLETVTLGMPLPDELRGRVRMLRWRWRVLTFPAGASECGEKSDSAAAVFVTFKRGLKYYIIKYAWTTEGQVGAVCNKRRNMFFVRDTVVRQSNGPTNHWLTEQIDPKMEFVRHFGGTLDEVPELVGIGLMTDGDQTHSRAEADYADFTVAT